MDSTKKSNMLQLRQKFLKNIERNNEAKDEVLGSEDRTRVRGGLHETAKNSEPESEAVRAKSEFTKDFEPESKAERAKNRDDFKAKITEDFDSAIDAKEISETKTLESKVEAIVIFRTWNPPTYDSDSKMDCFAHKIDDSEEWFACSSLVHMATQHLLNPPSSSTVLSKLNRIRNKHPQLLITKQPSTFIWNKQTQLWDLNDDGQEANVETWMIEHSHMQEFLRIWFLRMRLSTVQKQRAWMNLGLKFLTSCDGAIENDLLEVFIEACPLQVITQYRIGSFRVDAIIRGPKKGWGIAICINEKNHKSYDEHVEKNRLQCIRNEGFDVLIFVPDEKVHPREDGLRLVRCVWSLMLDPTFQKCLDLDPVSVQDLEPESEAVRAKDRTYVRECEFTKDSEPESEAEKAKNREVLNRTSVRERCEDSLTPNTPLGSGLHTKD